MKNMRLESTGTLLTVPSFVSHYTDPQGPKICPVSLGADLYFRVVRVMDVRREAETTFDWFKSYKDVAHLLRAVLPDKMARILILGCGNSTLSEDVCSHPIIIARRLRPALTCPGLVPQMYDDGYKNVVNVDVRS
jgi:hypothetical protein